MRPARWAALAGLVALLVLVVRLTGGEVFARRNPELALRLSPGNARALAQRARVLIQTDQSPPARAQAAALARRALLRDPGSVDAVVAAGIVADLERRPAEAERLFRYSERLSRRDLATQIWLIEAAVRRGDVAGALSHYDTALRTSRLAPSILFPVLTQAVRGSDMIAPLSTVLARRPAWSFQYMQHLAQNGPDLQAAAALFKAVRRRGGLVPEAAVAAAAARMVEARAFDAAWSLYADFHPGARRAGVRDGAFARPVEAPTPFDWNLTDAPDLVAQRVGDHGGVLRFQATSGAGGVAARQLLLLPPGAHRLTAAAFDVDLGQGSDRPALRLACAGSPERLAEAPLPAGPGGPASAAAAFSVPAGCPAQWLELFVPSADGPTPVSGAIGAVAVR